MPEAAYLGVAVDAGAVSNGDLGDFQIKLCRAEDKIEIPERVELSEEAPPRGDLVIILPGDDLRAA